MDNGIQYKTTSLLTTPTNINDAIHSFYHLNVFLVANDKLHWCNTPIGFFGVLTNHISLQLFVELYTVHWGQGRHIDAKYLIKVTKVASAF